MHPKTRKILTQVREELQAIESGETPFFLDMTAWAPNPLYPCCIGSRAVHIALESPSTTAALATKLGVKVEDIALDKLTSKTVRDLAMVLVGSDPSDYSQRADTAHWIFYYGVWPEELRVGYRNSQSQQGRTIVAGEALVRYLTL